MKEKCTHIKQTCLNGTGILLSRGIQQHKAHEEMIMKLTENGKSNQS